jgi:hypothetical protein
MFPDWLNPIDRRGGRQSLAPTRPGYLQYQLAWPLVSKPSDVALECGFKEWGVGGLMWQGSSCCSIGGWLSVGSRWV